MITGETFEERKESALKFKKEMKESHFSHLEFHKKLSQEVGDKTAAKLATSDVDSMTMLGGVFKRDLFINAVPRFFSGIMERGVVNKKEAKMFSKFAKKTADGKIDISPFDLAEIKVVNTRRDMKDAIQAMMEDGSTGDKLQKLTDRILRFGAMFLVFAEAEECAKIFEEWKDKLTTDEIYTKEDGTEERMTKEQLLEKDDGLSVVLQTDDCNCPENEKDDCDHKVWV